MVLAGGSVQRSVFSTTYQMAGRFCVKRSVSILIKHRPPEDVMTVTFSGVPLFALRAAVAQILLSRRLHVSFARFCEFISFGRSIV